MQREPRVPARRRLHAAGPVLFLATLLALACSGDSNGSGPTPTPAMPVDGTLTVRAFEWDYEPDSIIVPAGEELRIILENDGAILHNIKIFGLEAADVVAESTGPMTGREDELFVGADARDRGALALTPLTPGTYEFYCTVSGHRDLGMEGTFVVEAR